MPTTLLNRADEILKGLEHQDVQLTVKKADHKDQVKEAQSQEKPAAPAVEANGQLELFQPQPSRKSTSKGQKILHQLKELNLMGMTPMEVMNQLYEWQQKLK